MLDDHIPFISTSWGWLDWEFGTRDGTFDVYHVDFVSLSTSSAGLAGIEIIFFTVTGMGLGFGFVLQEVLIMTRFSYSEQCFHRVKVSPASHTTPPVRRLECNKLGGDVADPNCPQRYPVAYNSIKLGKEEGRRYDDLCLPKSPWFLMEPCFPGDGWTTSCPWEGVNGSLFCFDCMCG